MRFTIVTPSFNQLDWLRLCVASVRDQVATKAETGNLKPETGEGRPETGNGRVINAGSEGIEEFAREVETGEGR
jgi:hypothetical protein